MLVNANCPHSYRDTVYSLSPIYREERKKARILCTTTQGPSNVQFPAELREQKVFLFFLAEHGCIDSIKFLLRQERIKMNLEQKWVEILY